MIVWYYTADRLRVGGLVVLDDTQLWSVNILKQFLMQEPEWQLERDLWPRNAIFSRVREGSCSKNENAQPFIVRQTIDLLYPEHIDMIRPYLHLEILKELEDREVRDKLLPASVENVWGSL